LQVEILIGLKEVKDSTLNIIREIVSHLFIRSCLV